MKNRNAFYMLCVLAVTGYWNTKSEIVDVDQQQEADENVFHAQLTFDNMTDYDFLVYYKTVFPHATSDEQREKKCAIIPANQSKKISAPAGGCWQKVRVYAVDAHFYRKYDPTRVSAAQRIHQAVKNGKADIKDINNNLDLFDHKYAFDGLCTHFHWRITEGDQTVYVSEQMQS